MLIVSPEWPSTTMRTRSSSTSSTRRNRSSTSYGALSDITGLQKSIDWSAWKERGIEIVSTGPTGTGFLRVGVTKHVAQAQDAFDAKYGRGVIRVFKAAPVIAASLVGR